MGKRSTARRLAMQVLYEVDMASPKLSDAFEAAFEEGDFLAESKLFAEELVRGVLSKLAEINRIIASFSKDWPIKRMGVVDRSILRLAIYEIKYTSKTPTSVVINEAIELAKKYATPESAKFINGILGGLVAGD